MTLPDSRNRRQAKQPWFSNRSVSVVVFRINRRPRSQGSLFRPRQENFMDHLREVLLYGESIRVGKRGNRRWRLGHQRIDPAGRFIAGILGWETQETHQQDYFDRSSAQWVPGVATNSRVTLAPFSIHIASRRLFVVKHHTFRETTIATVFRKLLNQGEQTSITPTTDWDVQPLLDEEDFEDWLCDIAVLDQIKFVAKLPNPDAEEEFLELIEQMEEIQAGKLTHILTAADTEAGLSKRLQENRITRALMHMSKQGYASISASAHDNASRKVKFLQSNRTLRILYGITSEEYNNARDELSRHILESEESDGG